MTKKKKLAFLFGFTPNLSFAAANAAISINRYMSEKNYDIIMYYTDLSEQDINAFKKIPHVILHKFNLPDEFINVMLQNLPNASRFRTVNHLMCFCHFEVFPLLEKYETVVWNDVDIGVQGDLSGILSYGPLGLCPDTPWRVVDQFTQKISGFNMDIPAYCSGVMVVKDTLPYMDIYKWLYSQAIEYSKYLINPDQSIINLMLQKFKLKPKEIPLTDYNCISWRDDAIVAKIVHFGTEQKVWNNTNICNSFPEWYRTHLEWLALGGSDFDQSKITPRNPRGALDYLDKLTADKDIHANKKYKIYLLGFPVLKIILKPAKIIVKLFSLISFLKIKRG